MTVKRPVWLLSLLGAAACSQPAAAPPPRPTEAEDVKAVEQVLLGWYRAMETHDTAGTAAPLTASFLIYEDTTRIPRAELLEGLNAGFGSGVQRATLSGLETRVNGDVAWTSFRNHETFTPTDGKPDTLDFVETVVFVRESGTWKIDRYHATRINRP
jgi:ketosteroid isomerase-like protein